MNAMGLTTFFHESVWISRDFERFIRGH